MANNPLLFNAALAGAIGGAHTSRWITDQLTAQYTNDIAAAVAFANIVDSAIATDPTLTASDAALLLTICNAVIETKSITTAADSTRIAGAIAALWNASKAGLAPVPVTPANIEPLALTLIVDPDTTVALAQQNGSIAYPFETIQQAHDALPVSGGTIIVCDSATVGGAGDLSVSKPLQIVGFAPEEYGTSSASSSTTLAFVNDIGVTDAFDIDLMNVVVNSIRITGENPFVVNASHCTFVDDIDCGGSGGTCRLDSCTLGGDVSCQTFLAYDSTSSAGAILATGSATVEGGSYVGTFSTPILMARGTSFADVTVNDPVEFSDFIGCDVFAATTKNARFEGGRVFGINPNANSTNFLIGVTIPPGGSGISGNSNTYIGCAIGEATAGDAIQSYVGCKWITGTHAIVASSIGTLRFESSYVPSDMVIAGDSSIADLQTDRSSWDNIVKLGIVFPTLTSGPNFFDIRTLGKVTFVGTAGVVATVLPAGHPPGMYLIAYSVATTAFTAFAANVAVTVQYTGAVGAQNSQQTGLSSSASANSILNIVTGSGMFGANQQRSVLPIVVFSTGATAITLTLSANAGNTFTADLYSSATFLGSPPP